MFGTEISISDSVFISIFSMMVVFLVLLIISYMIDIVAFLLIRNLKMVDANVTTTSGGSVQASANTINAPLQGTLQTLYVKVGDKVKAGDTIAIIEAMKMENDVPANISGTVKEIYISTGSKVENGAAILSLE